MTSATSTASPPPPPPQESDVVTRHDDEPESIRGGIGNSFEWRLRSLGDPSGQQTADYWDRWFRTVCVDEEGVADDDDGGSSSSHRPFEWYASPEEVTSTVLSRYLEPDAPDGSCDAAPTTTLTIVRLGSGNSLLPLHLRDRFGIGGGRLLRGRKLKQVVVDVSSVALEEMRRFHDGVAVAAAASASSAAASEEDAEQIEYALGDVLNPPLPHSDGSFDAWIDKGLLDALFSGKPETVDEDERKCRAMFGEAHRLLKKGGVVVVISMAEEHSLRLILSNWWRGATAATMTSATSAEGDEGRGDGLGYKEVAWDDVMNVHELQPTTGAMRPFGFVLCASGREDSVRRRGKPQVMPHRRGDGDGAVERIWPLRPAVGEEGETNAAAEADGPKPVLDAVWSALDESRAEFIRGLEEAKGAGGDGSADERRRTVLATIEVKPANDEVDLAGLCRRIVSTSWGRGGLRSMRWYDNCEGDRNHDPALPHGHIVPIGYGISELVLQCVINADDVEELCEAIVEREGEDVVMSVDVDWDETVPVQGIGSLGVPPR